MQKIILSILLAFAMTISTSFADYTKRELQGMSKSQLINIIFELQGGDGSDDEEKETQYGCKMGKTVQQAAKLQVLTYVGLDKTSDNKKKLRESKDILQNARLLTKVICNQAGKEGQRINYSNGQIATKYAGYTGQSWYYPNGQLAVKYASYSGETWYFPNGQMMVKYHDYSGQTFYYPNGQMIIKYMGYTGQRMYYANGQMMVKYNTHTSQKWYFPKGTEWARDAVNIGEKYTAQSVLRKIINNLPL